MPNPGPAGGGPPGVPCDQAPAAPNAKKTATAAFNRIPIKTLILFLLALDPRDLFTIYLLSSSVINAASGSIALGTWREMSLSTFANKSSS